jgi:hypothetical protein
MRAMLGLKVDPEVAIAKSVLVLCHGASTNTEFSEREYA